MAEKKRKPNPNFVYKYSKVSCILYTLVRIIRIYVFSYSPAETLFSP